VNVQTSLFVCDNPATQTVLIQILERSDYYLVWSLLDECIQVQINTGTVNDFDLFGFVVEGMKLATSYEIHFGHIPEYENNISQTHDYLQLQL